MATESQCSATLRQLDCAVKRHVPGVEPKTSGELGCEDKSDQPLLVGCARLDPAPGLGRLPPSIRPTSERVW
jgi:hypothetical protein